MAKFWKHLIKHPDAVIKHKITDEEITFLKRIQEELNTQDTVGQADPRYWVIRDYEKIHGENLSDVAGIEIYDSEAGNLITEIDTYGLEISEIGEKVLDGLEKEYYSLNEDTIEELRSVYDMESLISVLKETDEYDLLVLEYQKIPVNKGMFLTHEAAMRHLKENAHHYSEEAHTYAMTAWRSSEERLWEILQTVDFDQITAL